MLLAVGEVYMQAPSLMLLIKMALENTSLSDGADDAGIARYIRASFAIAGNCVLCILHHSQRSKEPVAVITPCTLDLRKPTPLMHGP